MTAHSKLQALLNAKEFVVTGELGPPKGPNLKAVEKKAGILKDYIDAVNVTDNQTAIVRMSSIAVSALLVRMGLEPVVQMTCRDRNRIAIQSDIIGAAALGIKNILCLSGDHQNFGNQPYCKNVFDIDSMQLIAAVKRMRDENKLLGVEDELKTKVDMFIGAAANPFAEPLEYRPYRLKKKIEAGAEFIQTQCIFDLELFNTWLQKVRELGLHERCAILAGITVLKSGKMAEYMADHVSGVVVPRDIVDRMKKASAESKEAAAEEGVKISCEQIEQIKQMEGVRGVHIMAIEWEKKIPEIVKRAGLYPRPEPPAEWRDMGTSLKS